MEMGRNSRHSGRDPINIYMLAEWSIAANV
jgi:hypothetical protein